MPERYRAPVRHRQHGHGRELPDREKCDERKRIHAGQVGFAVGDVHRSPQNSCAQSGGDPERGLSRRGLMRRGDGQQRGSSEHADGAAQNAEPALPSRIVQFVEEQESPEDAEQAVGIPQGKRDAQADIANGVNGQCIGDRPHASGEHSPHNQMRSLAHVVANVRSAANERRNAPARQEHSKDHDEGDGDGRNIRVDEFDGSFGAAEPRSGSESAKNAERLQAAEASGVQLSSCRRLHTRRGVQRSLSRRRRPPAKTLRGIQKWTSVAMARNKFGRAAGSVGEDIAIVCWTCRCHLRDRRGWSQRGV